MQAEGDEEGLADDVPVREASLVMSHLLVGGFPALEFSPEEPPKRRLQPKLAALQDGRGTKADSDTNGEFGTDGVFERTANSNSASCRAGYFDNFRSKNPSAACIARDQSCTLRKS